MKKGLVIGSMKASLAAGVLALAPMVHAAKVYADQVVAETTFNWSTGGDGVYHTGDDVNNQWGQIEQLDSGTAAITADFPQNGNGSLRLASNGGASSKGGVAYYPPGLTGFGPLSSITAASFEYKRDSASANPAPVMRLFLFNPGTDTHVATLVWTSGLNGVTDAATDAAWQTADVLGGTVIQLKSGGPFYNQSMTFAAAKQAAELQGLIVRAVEVGFGRGGWNGDFVSGADTVLLTGSAASVSANFEATRPPPPEGVASVPTLSEWGMVVTGLLLAGAAAARVRRRQG